MYLWVEKSLKQTLMSAQLLHTLKYIYTCTNSQKASAWESIFLKTWNNFYKIQRSIVFVEELRAMELYSVENPSVLINQIGLLIIYSKLVLSKDSYS